MQEYLMNILYFLRWSTNKRCILLKLENLYSFNVSITRTLSYSPGHLSYGDLIVQFRNQQILDFWTRKQIENVMVVQEYKFFL